MVGDKERLAAENIKLKIDISSKAIGKQFAEKDARRGIRKICRLSSWNMVDFYLQSI
jgi:hypothetical protein